MQEGGGALEITSQPGRFSLRDEHFGGHQQSGQAGNRANRKPKPDADKVHSDSDYTVTR
jgi:hypothetical protein